MVVVLHNVSIHTKDEVRELIERAGYTVQCLPPYSPDCNPIELTLSVLKAWIKRNCEQDFGAVLVAAIQ